MEVFNRVSKIYDSIGKCIYCGCSKNLSNEHIIPKGLSGTLIFLNGSCDTCRINTSRFEDASLRKDFKAYRGHGLYPMNDYVYPDKPYWLSLPEFPRPGILIGRASTPNPLALGMHMYWFDPKGGKPPKIRPPSPRTIQFHLESFIRMLAKIAHGYVVGEMKNPDRFIPFLPDLILGRKPELMNHLVGAATPQQVASVPFPIRTPVGKGNPIWTAHQTKMGVFTYGPHALISVLFRLFAIHRTPLYEVVVGELRAIPANEELYTQLGRSVTNPNP